MKTELGTRTEERIKQIALLLRAVGLDTREVSRLVETAAGETIEETLRKDAREQVDSDGSRHCSYRTEPATVTARLVRDSSVGIALPAEYTHEQLREAFASAIRVHGHEFDCASWDDETVDITATETPILRVECDGQTDEFQYPRAKSRRERFVAFATYLDIFGPITRSLTIGKLHTDDDQHTAAVIPPWAFDMLRGESASVSISDSIIFEPFQLSEVGPVTAPVDSDRVFPAPMLMEYLVPAETPETEWGDIAREVTELLERFGPETETIFYNFDEIWGPRSPPVVDHVFESLECRLRTLMASRETPPTYGMEPTYLATETLQTAPFTGRLDAASVEHVQWYIPPCFEHYGYEMDFQYLDGTPLSERKLEHNGHPEAFEISLTDPAGQRETMCFRYPAGEPGPGGNNMSPRNVVAALNRGLLDGTGLEFFRLDDGSGMWAYTLVDTETFDGAPGSASVFGEQILEPVDTPLHRSNPDDERDHETTYGIPLPDDCVTWDATDGQ